MTQANPKSSDRASNTGKKQANNRKPPPVETQFKKGDPRINRKGRPRKADELRAQLLEKWDAPAFDAKGNPLMVNGVHMTYGEVVVERMFRSEKQYGELLNRAFGKVKEETEHTGDIKITVHYGERKAH